jgi:hypothetical protein
LPSETELLNKAPILILPWILQVKELIPPRAGLFPSHPTMTMSPNASLQIPSTWNVGAGDEGLKQKKMLASLPDSITCAA